MSVSEYVNSVSGSVCKRTHIFRKVMNVATKLDGLLNLIQPGFSVLLIKITGVCCSRLDDIVTMYYDYYFPHLLPLATVKNPVVSHSAAHNLCSHYCVVKWPTK
jgi:hypothetical protein